MTEQIRVDTAFDPETRVAQREWDDYIQSRPDEGIVTSTDETDAGEQINVIGASVDRSSASFSAVATGGLTDITKSFERLQVPVPSRSKLDKIGMMFDDVSDGNEWLKPPYSTEFQGPEAVKLVERLLPEETPQAIRRMGDLYEDGHVYRRIKHVGDKDKGDFHPHYYYLDTTRPGVTRVYFVDPEHKVAHNKRFRPSIANLVGIEVPDQEGELPKVAIIRCRVPEYDYEQKPEGLGPDELRTVIEQVLDNNGGLPDRLSGDQERQVLFMITASSESSRVQARYSTSKQMESFARGGEGSRALESKVWAQKHVVNALITEFGRSSRAREVA